MNKRLFIPLFAALMLGGLTVAQAADEWTPEQLQKIESLLHRADRLASGKPGADGYHLAKARIWLDMALSEYYENEGNNIVAAVIAQIEPLLDALEKKQAGISTATIGMDTPRQIEGSEAVRPDLWEKIAALKNRAQFSCGETQVAEAEVHLVWAGHEKYESSWEYAQSYARTAEELINKAMQSIDNCAPPPAPAPAPVPPEAPPLERITLSGDAMFALGKAKLSPEAQASLDKLTENIKTITQLEEIVLIGHTDQLRSSGRRDLNQVLSEQRAESIKQYLIGKGIPEDKIHAKGAGSSLPLVQCSPKLKKSKLVECLKPNRRVEIILRGTR